MPLSIAPMFVGLMNFWAPIDEKMVLHLSSVGKGETSSLNQMPWLLREKSVWVRNESVRKTKKTSDEYLDMPIDRNELIMMRWLFIPPFTIYWYFISHFTANFRIP